MLVRMKYEECVLFAYTETTQYVLRMGHVFEVHGCWYVYRMCSMHEECVRGNTFFMHKRHFFIRIEPMFSKSEEMSSVKHVLCMKNVFLCVLILKSHTKPMFCMSEEMSSVSCVLCMKKHVL